MTKYTLKKHLALLLAAVMVIGLFPVSAAASESAARDVLPYAETDGMDMEGAPEPRNIQEEVDAVIDGVKTVKEDNPDTDWILAMSAAGLSPADTQLQTYLAYVLTTAADFAHSGSGSPATMAKMAIALTSLGIDARQIPDSDGGEAIDLVGAAAAAYDVKADNYALYSAPYLLSLYDLPHYGVPVGAKSTRAGLIDAIIDAEEDWAAWGYDGVGMVLPALAPYYGADSPVNGVEPSRCEDITAAADRALGAMSAAQTTDGGFGEPNSNTAATVITGLSAIGIDSNSDSRFVKDETSLLMNLLSFRTADDKIGFADASLADDYSSLQAFQALAVWRNLSNARGSNLYNFTGEIVPYTNWPDARLLTGIAVTTPPETATYPLGAADTAPNTAGIVVTATYNADASDTEVIDIGDCTVSTIDCTTPGTKTVTVTYQGLTAAFLVTVADDTGGGEPARDTVSVTVQNGGDIIAQNSAVVIEAGVTSAIDVLKIVLAGASKAYVIRNGSYVEKIDGLGEFSGGANSGWLYSVNGVTPSVTSASDYTLSDRDAVLWYYTINYTADSSSSEWTGAPADGNSLTPAVSVSNKAAFASVSAASLSSAIAAVREHGNHAIVIEPDIAGTAVKVAIDIPASSLSDVAAQTAADLTVKTPVGSVTIPNRALSAVAAQAAGDVTVTFESVDAASLTAAQREAVGENSVYDISVSSGGGEITAFGDGGITISLPYTLKSGEGVLDVKVWYLGSSGTLRQMAADYDTASGLAVFTTTHLSSFAVGCRLPWANTFLDIQPDDWFYSAVEYAVQSGLLCGISNAYFAPDEAMTRSMLVTVLHRLEGSPPPADSSSFSDVQNGEWYADAAAWAAEAGIVSGVGGGLFGPHDSVTREQIATILYRYADYKGFDVSKMSSLENYTDAQSVSTWAEDALRWANAEGLITGTTAGTLSPADSASRAQAAVILHRLHLSP